MQPPSSSSSVTAGSRVAFGISDIADVYDSLWFSMKKRLTPGEARTKQSLWDFYQTRDYAQRREVRAFKRKVGSSNRCPANAEFLLAVQIFSVHDTKWITFLFALVNFEKSETRGGGACTP